MERLIDGGRDRISWGGRGEEGQRGAGGVLAGDMVRLKGKGLDGYMMGETGLAGEIARGGGGK